MKNYEYDYIHLSINFDKSNPEELEIANHLLAMRHKKKDYVIKAIKEYESSNPFKKESGLVTEETVKRLIKEILKEKGVVSEATLKTPATQSNKELDFNKKPALKEVAEKETTENVQVKPLSETSPLDDEDDLEISVSDVLNSLNAFGIST